MELTPESRLLIQSAYLKSLCGGVAEPAVLLLDVGSLQGRNVLRAVVRDGFDSVVIPASVTMPPAADDAGCEGTIGMATGRLRLMRILRDRLGENCITKALTEWESPSAFCAIVVCESGAMLLALDKPRRGEPSA